MGASRARAAAAERQAKLDSDRRRAAEVGRVGVMDLIGVGVTVYTDPDRRRNDRGEGLGGVVVAIEEGQRDDAGYVQRTLTCLQLAGASFRVRKIDECDVTASGVEATNNATLVKLVGALFLDGGRRIAKVHMIDSVVLDRCRWLMALVQTCVPGA